MPEGYLYAMLHPEYKLLAKDSNPGGWVGAAENWLHDLMEEGV